MSKYKAIQTEWNSQESLVQALKDLGYHPEVHQEAAHLFGYTGDRRQDTAHVIVRRAEISGSANDLGFVKLPSGKMGVIISDWDSASQEKGRGAYIVQQLKQAYAVADLTRRAKQQGLSVVKKVNKQGKMMITLQGISR